MNHSQQVHNDASLNNNDLQLSYRMVNKKFFCHNCRKEFKQMINLNEQIEVSCPECQDFFCEEVDIQDDPRVIYQQSQNDRPASPHISEG